MSLQNLVGVSLDTITPSRDTVTRLRSAAKRQIADAQVAGVSAETRFAAAECLAQAKALQTWVADWLKTHKPELL